MRKIILNLNCSSTDVLFLALTAILINNDTGTVCANFGGGHHWKHWCEISEFGPQCHKT